ncbi:MAG TPA: uroporphyrinogen decarboxylase family protein [Candidatus Acidoferrales bacterium]|nr:uroporphyrinogen decarboxylase family protein [Candidatus Acidoferrales bacterium]
MPANATPRQIVQGLLQGIAPPRPLFLPIVFSHGARVENVPLRAFLTNPTKISNSLRQIRAHLHSDGVSCYFDPYIEAEALGGTLHWEADDRSPALRWPPNVARGEWPEDSRSLQESAKKGRVAVAVDVIRRLKSVLRDDCLLMAGVTGPYTLGALLTQQSPGDAPLPGDVPASMLDLAAAMIGPIATAFLEAGANVVFIREAVLPTLSEDAAADWASRLGTTINIIRFYQALPVLLLDRGCSFAANREAILQQHWDCVVCPVLDQSALDRPGGFPELGAAGFGVALPTEAFEPGDPSSAEFDESLHRIISDLRPAVITTAGDVPAAAEMERLNKVWENVRS